MVSDSKSAENDTKYVVWPGILRMEREAGAYSLYHPGHGTSLDVEPESSELLESILDGFAEPITLADFHEQQPNVPEELVDYVLRSLFIVAENDLPFLEHGFLRPTTTPIGIACAWSDLPEVAQSVDHCLIGVPVDMAALGAGGARLGPAEIRKALSSALFTNEGDLLDFELQRLYPAPRPPVADLGDIDPEGARLDHVGSRLRKVVGELLENGVRPLILGGDHSLTHFVLAELCERVPRFGILHFDAHADMGPSRTLSHANIFHELLDSPQIAHVVQIGLRVMERVSPFATRVPCSKRTVVSAKEAASGLAMQALSKLPRDIPYYLTFDIDCIDASIVRETGTPAFGGLSVELAVELVDYIARTFGLLGADFVEVSGAVSGINAAAAITANLVTRCVLGNKEFSALSSDVYTFGG